MYSTDMKFIAFHAQQKLSEKTCLRNAKLNKLVLTDFPPRQGSDCRLPALNWHCFKCSVN